MTLSPGTVEPSAVGSVLLDINATYDRGILTVSVPLSEDSPTEKRVDVIETILAKHELQCNQDARKLSGEELAKKYPDLKPKFDEAAAIAVKKFGDGVKLRTLVHMERLASTYRVLAAKPGYLLVEDTANPPRKTAFALDRIKTVTWSHGPSVVMDPDRSLTRQE